MNHVQLDSRKFQVRTRRIDRVIDSDIFEKREGSTVTLRERSQGTTFFNGVQLSLTEESIDIISSVVCIDESMITLDYSGRLKERQGQKQEKTRERP